MALRKFLFQNQTEGFFEEQAAADELSFGKLSLSGIGGIALDAGSQRITSVATPTAGTDGVNKNYVDSVATGLDVKQSVRVVPTASLAAFTAAGSGIGATLTAPTDSATHNTQDGVLLAVGNRVLVATRGGSMTTPDADNGIYTVFSLGNGAGTSFVLTRAVDFDQDAEVTAGAFTFATEGSANGDKGFVLVTNDPITVDTTALQFSQFSSTTAFTFDAGLSESGGAINVELDTAADAQSAGSGGGSSGLEFDAAGAAGKLRARVGATGAINRGADGLILELDPLANTAGSNPTDATTATGLKTVRAPKTEENYIANEAFAVGDPVAWAAGVNDKLAKGRADTDAKSRIMGIARTASTALNDTAGIVSEGVATGVLTGATAGDPFYLQDTGGVGTFAAVTSGKRVIRLGFAKNATDLFVDIADLGKKA
jgi:hypothetical protein